MASVLTSHFSFPLPGKKLGIPSNANSSLISYYEPDIRTAQDYYPFGMLMPGRKGIASGTVWVVEGSGGSLPASISYSTRTGNTPLEYKATNSIEFTEGFESGLNDEFVAYITTYGGTGGSSGIEGSEGIYRYGFNGKENDNEVKGEGNQQDYGMRIYDPRLGKFLSVDPLAKSYSMLTPYQFAANNPIAGVDLDGEEFKVFHLIINQNNGKTQIKLGDFRGLTDIKLRLTAHVGVTNTGHFGPVPFTTTHDETWKKEFGFADLGISATVVDVPDKGLKILPDGIDFDNLPAMDDPAWNSFESPEEYTNRFIKNAQKIVSTISTGVDFANATGGIIKNGIRNNKQLKPQTTTQVKKVPNPNGKNGGKRHQDKIDEVERQLRDEGYDKIEREVMINTPNGTKKRRFIDIQGTNSSTGAKKPVQVGKKNQDGSPVSRERKALDDIEGATKQRPEFVPYN